jgi:hypothetical protein
MRSFAPLWMTRDGEDTPGAIAVAHLTFGSMDHSLGFVARNTGQISDDARAGATMLTTFLRISPPLGDELGEECALLCCVPD